MTTNEDLQSRKDKVLARGFGNLIPVFTDHARNAEIWDVEGGVTLTLPAASQ